MTTSPAVINAVIAKLSRADLTGVNVHTLPVALHRAEQDQVPLMQLGERQAAIALLERAGYPTTMQELSLFLNVNPTLSPTALIPDEITEQHAPSYITWLAGFLNDPEPNIQKNARILLRWLVANRENAIRAQQGCLNGLRQIADDPVNNRKNAALIAYALGVCGTTDDYDVVIRQAEIVIEHDREHTELIAEALYRLYPPALLNALQYFLETAPTHSKQFSAGIQLLEKVSEIEDKTFWQTYFDDMDKIAAKVSELVGRNATVSRILDVIEKHLALANAEE